MDEKQTGKQQESSSWRRNGSHVRHVIDLAQGLRRRSGHPRRTDPAKAGTFEISAPRRVNSLKGASWVTCVKTQNFPLLPRYYAVFLQHDHIVDSRLSVLIDQCELQAYSLFDWIADANAPPVQ